MASSWLFFIGIIPGVALFIAFSVFLGKFAKDRLRKDLGRKDLLFFSGLIAGEGLLTIVSSYGLALWGGWPLKAGEHFAIIFGSYFFGSGFLLFVFSFAAFFYKRSIREGMRKIIRDAMIVGIILLPLSFFVMTDGFADHLSYPLPNRISFTRGLINVEAADAGFVITFYGILIVTGAVIAYFIADHEFYKKFHKHGLLDVPFLVAFPAGLVGARLWFCLVLEPEHYLANPVEIFEVWRGGLAIQGGILLGAIFGIGFMLLFRKKVNIRWAMDAILPAMLIAQAVGRYGNFFNCEVHGYPVLMADWAFLPKVILGQMQYHGAGNGIAATFAGDGMIYLPLFFIESTINVCAYFIITKAIAIPLKKWRSLGDQAAAYIIWYGIVRVTLERLRYAEFEYEQSWATAVSMIVIGVVMIIAFHVYDWIRDFLYLPPRTPTTV